MGKITPGERAINWAKAIAIVVGLFGTGVFTGNTDIFHNWARSEPVVVTQQHEHALIPHEHRHTHPELKDIPDNHMDLH